MSNKLCALVVCCAALAVACGDATGSFVATANVNGTDHEFSSGCVLVDVNSSHVAIDATNRGSNSGFYGFSAIWSPLDVPVPGSYDAGDSTDIAVFFERPHPTESGTIRFSSVGEGVIVFDDLDTNSMVSGRIIGMRMERDNDDETISIVLDGDFVCER